MPKKAAGPADLLASVERAARAAVSAAGPHLVTRRRWGHDWMAGTDLVCLVGRFSSHVGVEFWRGSSLAPDHPMLEGTGKNLRHVKLRTVAEARSAEFASLVRAAVELDGRSEPRRR